jgi:hypothetical protein
MDIKVLHQWKQCQQIAEACYLVLIVDINILVQTNHGIVLCDFPSVAETHAFLYGYNMARMKHNIST